MCNHDDRPFSIADRESHLPDAGGPPLYLGRGHDLHGAQDRPGRQVLQAGQQPGLPWAWRHCWQNVASEVSNTVTVMHLSVLSL